MRRGTLLPLLTLTVFLLTPTTVSAADQVYDGWTAWDGGSTVDDEPFDVLLADDNSVLRVTFLNESTVIPKKSCRDISVYEFCFDETSEEENPDIDSDGQLRPGVNVVVNKYDITTETDQGSPEMNIDVNRSNISLDDERDLTVTFRNTGDGAMFNFTGTVTPRDLSHDTSSDDVIQVGGDTYRVNGGIESGGNTTIPLTVTLTGSNPRVNITYAYDTSDNTAVDGAKDVSLQTPEFYNVSLDAPSTAELYEEHAVTLTIHNLASHDMQATASLTHTGNQVFNERTDKAITLSPGGQRAIEATYLPRYEGSGKINATTRLEWGLNTTETRSQTITTPPPNVTVDGRIQPAYAGDQATVNLTVSNNDQIMLHDPTATVRTPFGDLVKTVQDNITFKTSETYSFPYNLPNGIEPRDYDANIITRYTTKSDEQFKHVLDRSLTINPVAYDVRLDKTISDSSPSVNETVTVDVYAENTGIEPLDDLTVEEETTPTAYQNTTEVSLKADERQQIFHYNVTYNGNPITTTTRTDDTRLTLATTRTIRGESAPGAQRNQTPNPAGTTTGGINDTDTQVSPPGQEDTTNTTGQTQEEPDSAAGRIWSVLNAVTTTLENLFSPA